MPAFVGTVGGEAGLLLVFRSLRTGCKPHHPVRIYFVDDDLFYFVCLVQAVNDNLGIDL